MAVNWEALEEACRVTVLFGLLWVGGVQLLEWLGFETRWTPFGEREAEEWSS
jgi:hypothetical protein